MLPWSCSCRPGHDWHVLFHPTQGQSVVEQVFTLYVHCLSWLLKSGRCWAATLTVAFPSATHSGWKGARENKQYLLPVNILIKQKCVYKLRKGQSLLLWQAQFSFYIPCLLLISHLWWSDYISRSSQAWSSSSYFFSPRTQTPHKVCHTCFQDSLSVSLFLMPSWIYEPYFHASVNHLDLLETPHVLSIWHLTMGISHITKPNTCPEFLAELIFKLSLWAESYVTQIMCTKYHCLRA